MPVLSDKYSKYIYYIIISILSLIMVIFLPMLGTEIGLTFELPDTIAGWTVWIIVNISSSIINVLIFHCFMLQAKLNIHDNKKYQEAIMILEEDQKNQAAPRSPKKWKAIQYGQKGTALFIATVLSTLGFTHAILTFDYIRMISYVFTIIMGIIFGYLQMKSAEEYWIDEFWRYAKSNKEDSHGN